ncbi:hypothetical protein N9K16_01230 [Alphaproteobacteria bacterium]|jgi:hypothetical protein|nr:hypothetical protein [Alphaproteobacteria bacterium]
MKKIVILFLILALGACSAIHTNKLSFVQAERAQWREAAVAGDAEAQFRFGNSFCCGQSAYFSKEEAVKWWCKAAVQKHQDAIAALKQHNSSCPATSITVS